MKRLYALTLGLPLAAAVLLHYGCGSSEENQFPPGTGGGAAAGTGGNGTGATGTASSTGTGTAQTGGSGQGASGTGGGGTGLSDAGDFDADFSYDAPPFDADLQDACVDEVATADPVPLDIYFMLDRSGSMSTDCNVTWPAAPSVSSKWCNAINAIAGYIQDSSAEGNRAAIEFFSGYISINCSGSAYATPAVNLVNLTAQASQIITVMNGQSPGGVTPTEAALRGLASFTAANETAGRVMIGVLITDGDPCCGECNQTNSVLGGIVENHFNATGIHTFIVGMTGATDSNLESWADYPGAISHNNNCGSTPSPCYHYNVGNGDPSVFIAALQQIQNSVLGCTFNIPTPSQGVLDPDTVSVEYLAGGTPPAQTLPRVTNAGACTGDGWYYDNNTTPSVINLCPATCSTVQADPNAEINIRIACQGS